MHISVVPEGELFRVHVAGKAIRDPMSEEEALYLAEFIRQAEPVEAAPQSPQSDRNRH